MAGYIADLDRLDQIIMPTDIAYAHDVTDRAAHLMKDLTAVLQGFTGGCDIRPRETRCSQGRNSGPGGYIGWPKVFHVDSDREGRTTSSANPQGAIRTAWLSFVHGVGR